MKILGECFTLLSFFELYLYILLNSFLIVRIKSRLDLLNMPLPIMEVWLVQYPSLMGLLLYDCRYLYFYFAFILLLFNFSG